MNNQEDNINNNNITINNLPDNFRYYDENSIPIGNWIFRISEGTQLPYLEDIKNNAELILNTLDELVCIRCTKEINFQNYGGIEKFCISNTIFCPECEINMIVPKSRIPEPFDSNLSKWHMLAFGMFANRPISSDDEFYEESDEDSNDLSDMPALEIAGSNHGRIRLPYMELATNNKDKIINDFFFNNQGGVCIFCYKKINTSEDINEIENGGNTVCCIRCGIDAVVPISEVPEPFENTLDIWNELGFGT
jgi:hypothetical protein